MNPNNVWKKNRDFYIGVAGTVLEGGALWQFVHAALFRHAVFMGWSV